MEKGKKKKIVLLTALVIILIIGVAGIWAYFTDVEKVTNVFTIGNVKIELTETNFTQTLRMDNVMPAQVIDKNPQITNIGQNPAYVYLKVTIPKGGYTNSSGNLVTGLPLFTYTKNNGWTEMPAEYSTETDSSITKVYYYDTILQSTEGSNTTNALFDTVTVANFPNFDGVSSQGTQDIIINAYAVQADGLTEFEQGENPFVKVYDLYIKKSIVYATIHVGTETVGDENIKMSAGDSAAITTEDGENIRTYESSNTNVATVDSNGNISIVAGATVGQTATITLTGAVTGGTRSFTVEVENDVAVGTTVSYTTKLNNTDYTADWKVFHKEEGYVWLILGDVLPNSYVNISGISKSGDYNVYVASGGNRAQLINAMTTKANWSSLLKGTINGKSFDYTSSTDEKITAMGSPTLDLFIDSWNVQHPDNKLYKAKKTGMSDSIGWGYYVGNTENPTTYSQNIGTADGLYVLNATSHHYWLASPSARDASYVMYVSCSGGVYYGSYNNSCIAFRPVVCLPSSVLD